MAKATDKDRITIRISAAMIKHINANAEQFKRNVSAEIEYILEAGYRSVDRPLG